VGLQAEASSGKNEALPGNKWQFVGRNGKQQAGHTLATARTQHGHFNTRASRRQSIAGFVIRATRVDIMRAQPVGWYYPLFFVVVVVVVVVVAKQKKARVANLTRLRVALHVLPFLLPSSRRAAAAATTTAAGSRKNST
jgi:hypothetical protein